MVRPPCVHVQFMHRSDKNTMPKGHNDAMPQGGEHCWRARNQLRSKARRGQQRHRRAYEAILHTTHKLKQSDRRLDSRDCHVFGLHYSANMRDSRLRAGVGPDGSESWRMDDAWGGSDGESRQQAIEGRSTTNVQEGRHERQYSFQLGLRRHFSRRFWRRQCLVESPENDRRALFEAAMPYA